MQFVAIVDFLGFDQKIIKKGDRAGQNFYIVRLICENDTIDVMVFNDKADLISKILKAEKYQCFLGTFKLSQNSGNYSLSLLDLVPKVD